MGDFGAAEYQKIEDFSLQISDCRCQRGQLAQII
jgi:hypothetical protein